MFNLPTAAVQRQVTTADQRLGLFAQVQHNYKKQDQLFHMVMHLPVALTAVSGAVQSILSQEFGRTSIIIPNSVDCDRFRPGPLSPHPYTAVLTAPVSQVEAMLLITLTHPCCLHHQNNTRLTVNDAETCSHSTVQTL